LLYLYEEAKLKVKQLQQEAVHNLSAIEAELCHLKIENANLKSRLEDAEEKVEYYKERVRKLDAEGPIHRFNMVNMVMTNPYSAPDVFSARNPVKLDADAKGLIKQMPRKSETLGDEAKEFNHYKVKVMGRTSEIRTARSDKLAIWAKSYLPLIQKDKREDKKLKRAIFQGIPDELRAVVWFQLIGNIHQDYTLLYEQLLDLRESIKDKDVYRKSEKLIEKDLHRTFTTLELFKPGNLLNKPLRNILTAFIVHRPDIGYVQGMSYLAGMLLMNLDEVDAFSLFMALTNWDILYYCF
jgi:hypothetical protein